MCGRSVEDRSPPFAVEFRLLSTLARALAALLLILSLNPLHDCICECSSCGLNPFPHCLQVVENERCSTCQYRTCFASISNERVHEIRSINLII